ncbi:hypothetical protein HDV06_006485 [Boothiomyces sp. JEL0866]|nr:hypothetical protein HDV06_006474 [Boothiomyces sp. JEL0866]KAJ3324592.1 hypothetical protein HDV06_006485 [Boothiomyces sp. JEL0866]
MQSIKRQLSTLRPFHLAFPVKDLERARHFYKNVMKCPQGRESPNEWIDFDFFGHQIVCHKAPSSESKPDSRSHVDGHKVPIPHFGVVLEWGQFHQLAKNIRDGGIKFEIEPYLRFEGKPGEQVTMFFYDTEGNALEFKAFKHDSMLFETK